MMHEFRRAKRRKASDTILVTDAMTERVVGRLGNLSESGLLLMASETLVDDALYQLRFSLEDGGGAQPIEVGAHLLWRDDANAPGQSWAGLRFLGLAPQATRGLREWVGRGNNDAR